MKDLSLAIRLGREGDEGVRHGLSSIEQSSARLKDGIARMEHALAGAFAPRGRARALRDLSV